MFQVLFNLVLIVTIQAFVLSSLRDFCVEFEGVALFKQVYELI